MTDMIGGRATRVLLAIVAGVRTQRDVASVSGVRSTSTVTHHLESLRRAGLVSWERGVAGTIHPLVSLHLVGGMTAEDRAWVDEDVRCERYLDAAGG